MGANRVMLPPEFFITPELTAFFICKNAYYYRFYFLSQFLLYIFV